jgi:hypothetical protein
MESPLSSQDQTHQTQHNVLIFTVSQMQYWRHQETATQLKASIQQEWRWEKKQYTIWVAEVIFSARHRPQCPASPHCLFATYFKQVSLSVQGMLLYVHRLGVNHGVQQKLLVLLSIALS